MSSKYVSTFKTAKLFEFPNHHYSKVVGIFLNMKSTARKKIILLRLYKLQSDKTKCVTENCMIIISIKLNEYVSDFFVKYQFGKNISDEQKV